jgi:protease-4
MTLETLIEPERFWTTDKVLLVGIDGVLSSAPDEGGLFAKPSTLVQLKDVLKKAEEKESIRALLVRVNSPGGSVTASDLAYRELQRFKEKTGKKIVVIFMGVGASGGYYAAMAADAVFAHPTSVTGSIGVIAMFPELSELGRKIGFDMRVIKSGPLKDIGSMWRGFDEGEREVLQETIDSMYARFLDVVRRGRPNLDAETIRKLADGRVFEAAKAKEVGLIDEVGYIDDAFAAAKELANVADASLVTYRPPFDYRGHYYASPPPSSPVASPQVNLLNVDLDGVLPPNEGPFYYLWMP